VIATVSEGMLGGNYGARIGMRKRPGTPWKRYNGLGRHLLLLEKGVANGYAYRAPMPATLPATDYTTRVIPHCNDVVVPLEAAQILWQR